MRNNSKKDNTHKVNDQYNKATNFSYISQILLKRDQHFNLRKKFSFMIVSPKKRVSLISCTNLLLSSKRSNLESIIMFVLMIELVLRSCSLIF